MELLSIKGAAEFFKCGRQTIDNWLHNGVLKREKVTVKVGGRVFFIKEELENHVRELRQQQLPA